ncbi:MAG: hypothetical protein Q3962_01130 [Corynebacterium sp.]|nr:hypothetical protein [Corynebacterium sp.]
MNPISQIMQESRGTFRVGVAFKNGFILNFRHWKLWVFLGLIISIVMGACMVMAGFTMVLSLLLSDLPGNASEDQLAWALTETLSTDPLILGLILVALLGLFFVSPLIYNAAYRGLFFHKIEWADLVRGVPYWRTLLGVFLYLLFEAILSYIPLVSIILQIFLRPFYLFLPFVAVEGIDLGRSFSIGRRFYLPLVGVSIIVSILNELFLALFPLMFVPLLITAVAYGMARSIEEEL